MKRRNIEWYQKPEEHNYPAAGSYLALFFKDDVVEELIAELLTTEIKEFKAKDIFRASNLSLLGISNSHVEKNIKKIQDNHKLSPILLVRGNKKFKDQNEAKKLIIADGYHRLCAVYHYDEDALIPCKII